MNVEVTKTDLGEELETPMLPWLDYTVVSKILQMSNICYSLLTKS